MLSRQVEWVEWRKMMQFYAKPDRNIETAAPGEYICDLLITDYAWQVCFACVE